MGGWVEGKKGGRVGGREGGWVEGREGGWKRGWVGGQGNRNNNNKVLVSSAQGALQSYKIIHY